MEIGDHIHDYTLVAPLGEGGMGTVWKALMGDGREVALKFLQERFTPGSQAGKRFRREAEIQGEMVHPNIVQVLGFIDDPPCIVMEFINGKSLDAVLKLRGPLPIDDFIRYFEQITAALSFAHRKGIIHRDIKPANILMQADGTVKIMDFGIAKDERSNLTLTGSVMGTAAYIAPEQIRNAKQVDTRADVYTLALTAFELLTGRHPFFEVELDTGDVDFAMKRAHMELAAPDPRKFRADLPESMAKTILWALNKNPDDRPQDVLVFFQVLKQSVVLPEMTASPAAAKLEFLDELFSQTKKQQSGPVHPESIGPMFSYGLKWVAAGVIGCVALVFFIWLWNRTPTKLQPNISSPQVSDKKKEVKEKRDQKQPELGIVWKVIPKQKWVMMETEMSQRQYFLIMGENPSFHKLCEECPVEQVTYVQAQQACGKLNARLPTEVEWLLAGEDDELGEGVEKEKKIKSMNYNLHAKYHKGETKKTRPVSEGEPNQFGIRDLRGNVWEWVDGGCMGGAFGTSEPEQLRLKYKMKVSKNHIDDSLGFRCVRDEQ